MPEVADRLGLPASRIKQLLHDRKLLAVRRPDGTLAVPAAFFDGKQIVKGLHGTLTLLADCGFDDAEALRWLFTVDDSLPGTPIQAMVEHRGQAIIGTGVSAGPAPAPCSTLPGRTAAGLAGGKKDKAAVVADGRFGRGA